MTRRTTTQRGLGWTHRQQVAGLKARHVDGTPCWWCDRPMYRDAGRNWDRRTLEGDHSKARSLGGTRADRLLHSTCNRERGDGRRDHMRPAITGRRPKTSGNAADLGVLAMPWP
ncbi:hypothetical protein [Nocardia farcinica]|uniref:hypothetical protein n=2 Tax=Nocardia farcinica TaxID=37329 RepID=UPI001895E892|nr:hypothetical protein [Nocardia farcinica]MBF6411214.1 hypothetical protein [Nocardia farcinica]